MPPGWRLPNDEEWADLLLANGGFRLGLEITVGDNPGGAYAVLLEEGDSGFNALLGGRFDNIYGWQGRGDTGYYWSETDTDELTVSAFLFDASLRNVLRGVYRKDSAFSCRCIQE